MPCSATQHEFDAFFSDQTADSDQQVLAQDPFSDSYSVPHYQPRLPLRPIHMHLTLNFDISSRKLVGHARHTIQAQCLDATSIVLNAEDFVSVKVSSPHDENLMSSYDGHNIHVIFSHPVPKSQSVLLDVHYIVEDPIDGLFFSREHDGHFVVSDHETERARYWLPVVDHPIVRTTIVFDIITPADQNLIALANGEFIEETVTDGQRKTHWQMKQLTPSYIICVAIGRFIRADVGNHNGKPVSFFAPSGARISYTVEDLALTFGRTKEMLQFMERKVGIDLPWPKYYQWACGEVSGAMENSSIVSYDEWYILDERSMSERSHRVDSTVVHELAHTWFGNMVVCGDFCHSFLKESFATLISAEWYQFKNGTDDFQYTLAQYANSAFAETTEYMRPIVTRKYDCSWSLFDRHLYVNGAWRLHMLRVRLGNEQFWSAVSSYLRKRAWTTVETDDFRRDMEEFTGEELSSFFDQWFYSKGHPVLEATFSHDSKEGLISVGIKQVQASESKGISLFDLKVEVALELIPGKWETHVLEMSNRSSSAQFSTKVGTKPLQVIIDPEMKVLHNLAKFSGLNDDLSLRSLKHGPTFAGRYQAMRLLRDSGSKRARFALQEALRREDHWGLRLLIAETLGKTGRPDVMDSLIDAMFHESDARVLPTIVSAVGEFQEAGVEKALLEFIHDAEDKMRGYGAIAAALRGLGRSRNVEHIKLLRSFICDEARRGGSFEMAHGAATALGTMRDWKAVEELMEILNESENGRLPGRVRAALVRSIASGVIWEGRARRMQAFDYIAKLSKKEAPKAFRMACGWALAALSDAGSSNEPLDALEKVVENQSKGAMRNFKKRAMRNANNRDSGVKTMTGGMEKLQREVKELRCKIEELQSRFEAKDSNIESKGAPKKNEDQDGTNGRASEGNATKN